MKACLQMQPEFCSREKLFHYFKRQQNEKPTSDKVEDFQTVPLDDDHRTTEEIPDRHLCIHKHLVPHSLCSYPCPYMDYTSTSYHDTLDLSDISEFKDLMTTSSDEDIPGLDVQIGY